METLKMLNARKAVRQYSGQIDDDQLKQMLTAGNEGPVGMGEYKNYRLTAIQDPEILQKLNGIYEAPTVIVVSAKDPGPMEYISIGAIVHNMELAAEDLGLGANYNMASVKSIPSDALPSGFTGVFALTVGQTDQQFTSRNIAPNRIESNIVK